MMMRTYTTLPAALFTLVGALMVGHFAMTNATITAVPLPYGYAALEPHVSQRTLEFHYDKHYNKYLNTTNELIAGTKYDKMSLEDIIKTTWTDLQDSRYNDKARAWNQNLFNNAAQTWNHGFYWQCMSPASGRQQLPDKKSALYKGMVQAYGTLDEFGQKFTAAGNTAFGSGWAWLVCNEVDQSLSIVKTIGAENPLASTGNMIPILTMDVWEHAYYLDYQNRRPDYTETFWKHLVNWKFVEQRYDQCAGTGRIAEL